MLLLVPGCGDDTGSGTTGGTGGTGGSATGGTGGTGGAATGGTGGAATGGTGGATGGTGGAAPTCGTYDDTMMACANAADGAIIQDPAVDVATKAGDCGKANLSNCQAAADCIKTETGLSADCTECFNNNVQCVIKNCLSDCIADAGAPACLACRAEKCDPDFAKCSGLM